MKPSSKAAHKARMTRLFQEYREEFRLVRIESASVHQVIFNYAGERIDFLWSEGRFTRGSLSGSYLTQEDYAFLFTFAKEIMEAILKAHKENAKRRKAKREINNKLKHLEEENRQLDLFRK